MMCENLFVKTVGIDMEIYLGSGYILVAKHLLDGSQIGSALEQVCGKGVTQGVRRYYAAYTGEFAETLYYQ